MSALVIDLDIIQSSYICPTNSAKVNLQATTPNSNPRAYTLVEHITLNTALEVIFPEKTTSLQSFHRGVISFLGIASVTHPF